MHSEVIVLGNSAAWSGDHVIAHGVMRDAIDLPARGPRAGELGFGPAASWTPRRPRASTPCSPRPRRRAAASIRGARHVMCDDSDIQASRHARALVGGVLAAVIGRTDLFVSGGAEHQGPDGGGPIAVIARRRPG